MLSEYGNRFWPPGDYAVPMSIYGCPDPDVNMWHFGYINITFKENMFFSVPGQDYLIGPYGDPDFKTVPYQYSFCTMASNADDLYRNVLGWYNFA